MKNKKIEKKVIKKIKKTFMERTSEVYKKEIALYQKANIRKIPYIHFDGKTKVPFLSRMALKVLQFQGGRFETKFEDLLKK